MPKVTIDGVEIEVADGTTVLDAALSRGKEIPHYCYHPGLSIAGNCRMCLVEVEKAPKLLIGCATTVADGMVVRTESEKVRRARASMMEFFLINHPLDCPICDQAGECKLQDYAVEYGDGRSRYTEPKLALSKAVDIGRHVMLDQERCIQCSRCIRFCREVTGTGELAFFQRGERAQIGIHPGHRLDNPYSGNVVDICPVGALTLKEFRFRSRVWYLKNTASVCAGCARGCNVVVGAAADDHDQIGRLRRIVARYNGDVNGHWICDEGRLSWQRIYAAPRLMTAESPAGTPADWDATVAEVAETLREAAGRSRAGAILSPRLTSEDLYAWRRLFEALGGVEAGVRRIARGEDDDLLIRADKGANAKGAEWIFGAGATEASVLESARAGRLEALLVVGDPLDPDDTARLDDDVRSKVARVLFVGPFVSGAAEAAPVRLPMAAWSEQDGSIVNFRGRIQWLRRAVGTKAEDRPGWRIAADIADAAGVEFPSFTAPGEVLAALARDVAEYRDVDADTVGMLGVPGRTEAPAGA